MTTINDLFEQAKQDRGMDRAVESRTKRIINPREIVLQETRHRLWQLPASQVANILSETFFNNLENNPVYQFIYAEGNNELTNPEKRVHLRRFLLDFALANFLNDSDSSITLLEHLQNNFSTKVTYLPFFETPEEILGRDKAESLIFPQCVPPRARQAYFNDDFKKSVLEKIKTLDMPTQAIILDIALDLKMPFSLSFHSYRRDQFSEETYSNGKRTKALQTYAHSTITFITDKALEAVSNEGSKTKLGSALREGAVLSHDSRAATNFNRTLFDKVAELLRSKPCSSQNPIISDNHL